MKKIVSMILLFAMSCFMIGALVGYITDESVTNFQPMGANFGVLPPIEPHIRDKKERYAALSNRAILWYNQNI